MSVVVPLFLIAPLFLVPFGCRLLAVGHAGIGATRASRCGLCCRPRSS